MRYLANTKYGNFRITYPDKSYLVGLNYLNEAEEQRISSFSDRVRYNFVSGNPLSKIEFKLENEDFYRYIIEINSSRRVSCRVLQDNGITTLFGSSISPEIPLNFFSVPEDEIFAPYCQLVHTDTSLSLLLFKLNEDFSESMFFISAGVLVNVNQDFSYYSERIIDHSYVFIGGDSIETTANFYSSRKRLEFLKNSEFSEYPLICEDTSKKPKSIWLSDLVFYDSRPQIGYPYVGLADESIKISLNSSVNVYKTLEIVPSGGEKYIPLQIFFNKKRIFLKTTETEAES